MGHINFWFTLVNVSHTNINTIKKNAKALLVDSQDIGLQINSKKLDLNIMQNKYYIKIANNSLKIWQTSDIWERH
jgi:hypothetical protein